MRNSSILLRNMTSKATMAKSPISALPLPPSSHILTHNLTPDEATPSVSDFKNTVLKTKPSVQRRARMLAGPSHFSYVTPFPAAFPYRITAPDPPEVVEDRSAYIEKWLAAREAAHVRDGSTPSQHGLRLHYPENRALPVELIGLSPTGLKDCLPHLDVGNAFQVIGTPSLTAETSNDKADTKEHSSELQELLDVTSGQAVLMSGDDSETPYAPWSLRYSGHQFGSWAGQLGDGRAISILSTPHPNDPSTLTEIQLKGAGRTPFSRSADGLAVLRSSVREYLGAEAMHALSIPTTRSLTLVHLPDLSVVREQMETACVLARLAPSFIRIGSFQALNGPPLLWFGGGQQDPDLDALRKLGIWVGKQVLKLEGVNWEDGGDPWGKKLVLEVTRRNAEMVAGWQAYGFMHGVMNTDNISVLGLTIDYGPYAFMDVFDHLHICNHTDETGRYNYDQQPPMILYALRALLDALAPLIGAEAERNASVAAGWAADASEEQIKTWTARGVKEVQEEMDSLFHKVYKEEYEHRMRKRLGLRTADSNDEALLFRPLLNMMEEQKLDFHSTFRKLCSFQPSMLEDENAGALGAYIAELLSLSPDPASDDAAKTAVRASLKRYADRITTERQASTDPEGDDRAREESMRAANPRFVLRQWVLEEVIKRVERDNRGGRRVLAKVLQMASEPFKPWGGEDLPGETCPDAETAEERRLCGLGEKKMLGFQCSCSS